MSFFNYFYTLGGCQTKLTGKSSCIAIDDTVPSRWDTLRNWSKWVISFPIRFSHAAYNTALIIASKDITSVALHQITEGNSIHYLPMLFGKSGHVITDHQIIAKIATQFRNDQLGLFEGEKEDPFIAALQELFPEESVSPEDFLLSCSRNHVDTYRNPLLHFIGPKSLPLVKPELEKIAKEVLETFTGSGLVSAKQLTEMYTVAVIARLFLHHPGSLNEYQKIATAFSTVMEYQFLRKWSPPSLIQSQEYGNNLEILRTAIAASGGEFIDSLQASGMSSLRIKGLLLLVYGAGSETTSSVLQYVLWYLGRHPEVQESILQKIDTLENLIGSVLTQYSPVGLISRFARKDFTIKGTDDHGRSWKYLIPKGDGLIIPPVAVKKMVFGEGKHSCPGQWLARAEIISLVDNLLKNYKITSLPDRQELKKEPGYGFIKLEPVELFLQKRT